MKIKKKGQDSVHYASFIVQLHTFDLLELLSSTCCYSNFLSVPVLGILIVLFLSISLSLLLNHFATILKSHTNFVLLYLSYSLSLSLSFSRYSLSISHKVSIYHYLFKRPTMTVFKRAIPCPFFFILVFSMQFSIEMIVNKICQ